MNDLDLYIKFIIDPLEIKIKELKRKIKKEKNIIKKAKHRLLLKKLTNLLFDYYQKFYDLSAK